MEVEDTEEDEVQPPNHRNLATTEMAHDHRVEIRIGETEEINYPEVRDDSRVEVEGALNDDGDRYLNEGQTEITPPTQIREMTITEPEIKVGEDVEE